MSQETKKSRVLELLTQGYGTAEIASLVGVDDRWVRRVAAKAEPAPAPATTRRCRNKGCIHRFVPTSQQHFFCSDCQGLRNKLTDADLWSQEDILQEEGSLLPGADHLTMAKRAFAQKNQVVRKNTELVSLREYMRHEVRSLYEDNPSLRFPIVPPPESRGTGGGEREIILVCSDWQIGKLENGIGVEAMKRRVQRIQQASRQIVEHFRRSGYEIPRGRLVFGGDMIEGCYIYGGQNVSGLDRTANTHRLTRQIPLAAQLQASVAHDMASYLDEVEVDTVPGNHGRTNGRNDFADPEDNFDTLAAYWSADKTSNTERIKWNIHENWWGGFHSLGHYGVAIHGDQWRGPLSRLDNLLPGWVTSNVFDEKPSLFLTHHRHDFATIRVNGITVVQNGTIDGGSNWYLKAYGKSSPPTQALIVMSRRYGAEAIYPVLFDDEAKVAA